MKVESALPIQPFATITQPTTPFAQPTSANSTPSTSRTRKSVSFTPSVQIMHYNDSFSQSEIMGEFGEMDTISTPVKGTPGRDVGTPVRNEGAPGTPSFNEMPDMDTLYKTRSVIGTPTPLGKRSIIGTPTPRPRNLSNLRQSGGKSGDRIKAIEDRIREMQATPVRARRARVEENKEN
jgi:hypothetical protein